MNEVKKIVIAVIAIVVVCTSSFLCYKYIIADDNKLSSANSVFGDDTNHTGNDDNTDKDNDTINNSDNNLDDNDDTTPNKGESSSDKSNTSTSNSGKKPSSGTNNSSNKPNTNNNSSSNNSDASDDSENSNEDNSNTSNNLGTSNDSTNDDSNTNNDDNNSGTDNESGNGNSENKPSVLEEVYSKFESPSESIEITTINNTQIKVAGEIENSNDNNVYYDFIIKAPTSYSTDVLKNAYVKIDGYNVNGLKIELDNKGIAFCKISRNLRNPKGTVPVVVYWGAGKEITYTFNFDLEIIEN